MIVWRVCVGISLRSCRDSDGQRVVIFVSQRDLVLTILLKLMLFHVFQVNNVSCNRELCSVLLACVSGEMRQNGPQHGSREMYQRDSEIASIGMMDQGRTRKTHARMCDLQDAEHG